MPFNLLYANQKKSSDLTYLLTEAKKAADKHSRLGSGRFDCSHDGLLRKMNALEMFHSLNYQRSQQDRDKTIGILANLITDAMLFEYDVTQDDVFEALANVAVCMFTNNHTPMRVLGATVEAMTGNNK